VTDTLPPLPTRAQLEALAADLPGLWHAATTSHKDRKRLLRTLIADITLLPDPGIEASADLLPAASRCYHAAPAKAREIAIKVLDSFHTCPIPEVARLGRTLRAWRAQVLAHFDTSGVSNGGTEAINLIIEKVR
jgi:transposase